MGIHQADLNAPKNATGRLDRKAVERYLAGQGDLAEGLGVDAEQILALRRQALALSEAGKWQRAIDVVLGLVALGSVHPADPAILSRCYQALGKEEEARACAEHAEALWSALGLGAPEGSSP